MLALALLSPLVVLALLWVMERVEAWVLDGDAARGGPDRQVSTATVDVQLRQSAQG